MTTPGRNGTTLPLRLRWKIGDFVGRWVSTRLGAWIEGPLG